MGREKIVRIGRHGLLLALMVPFSALACQDGYPIAASQCDEWCDASQGLQCQSYDPAECVVGCAAAGGDAPECRAAWQAVISCLRKPRAATNVCSFSSLPPAKDTRVCATEQLTYTSCAVLRAESGSTLPNW